MAVPLSAVAAGIVIAGGLTLFAIGHPAGGKPPLPTTPSPTTPSLALAAAAPAAAGASSASSVAAGGFTLHSVSVEFPESDRSFPPGPGADVAQANCTACHSVGMVMNQPTLPRAAWQAEVHKMISVYKAPVTDPDAATIAAYLDHIKGAN